MDFVLTDMFFVSLHGERTNSNGELGSVEPQGAWCSQGGATAAEVLSPPSH